MADDDDEEEAEIYYVPKIPKIVITPISFHTPTLPPKPVSPGTTTPPEAPVYTPEWTKKLNLMTSYDVSVYVNPASVKDLLLATEYRVSLPELLEAAKDLSLKTEVLLQMMNWFVESNLLLKTEPTIVAHYGLLFDTFLKLKTDYTATLPEFKTYESNLSLKTENITELMTIIERARSLGLSVEVGVIPTIGVTMDIYAGTRVEVELSSSIEIVISKENRLKTDYTLSYLGPVTALIENKLETYYIVGVPVIASRLYDGYVTNLSWLYRREVTDKIKVENIAELTIYPPYWLKYADVSLKLADEYLVHVFKVSGMLYDGYVTNIDWTYRRSGENGIGVSVSYGVS